MADKVVKAKTEYDPAAKIWRGPRQPDRYPPDTSLGSVLIENLLKDPEHVGQICYDSGKQYTNRTIAQLSIRVAYNLRTKLDLKQKDVIGLCATNTDFVAPLVFGALAIGATVSTLDPSFNKEEIQYIFSITRPKVIFCNGGIYATVKDAFSEANLTKLIYTLNDHPSDSTLRFEELIKTSPTSDKSEFVFPKLIDGKDQVGMILCSSGTTGMPKGVYISHYSLLNMPVMSLNREDKLLCYSTLYWLSGVICLFAGTMCGAIRIISEQGYKPHAFFDVVKRYQVTALFTPPSLMAMTLLSSEVGSCDLSSVKLYLCGGSSVPFSLYNKFRKYIPNAHFIVGYGMTELAGPASSGTMIANCIVGQLLPNVDLKIIDEKDKLLGPTETGEICVRTRFPWAGYCNNRKATEEVYDSDGWIHSGDIGYMDNDGNLFIIDRKKDIMKYNNYQFSPSEIESVLNELPGISEATVVGIPDEISSFLPAAAVVKMPGSDLSENDIIDYISKKLVHYKHLRGGVYFFNELPKTPSGKNIRRKVLEMCLKRRQQNQT